MWKGFVWSPSFLTLSFHGLHPFPPLPLGLWALPVLSSPPSASGLRRHQALKPFLMWITGPRMWPESGWRVDFPMGQERGTFWKTMLSLLSGFLSVPVAFLFPLLANTVTRRGLCVGKANGKAKWGSGKRVCCSAQPRVLPGLVVASLQETELQAVLGLLARVLMDGVILKTPEFLLRGIFIVTPEGCHLEKEEEDVMEGCFR